MEDSVRIAIADNDDAFAARLETYLASFDQFNVTLNGDLETILPVVNAQLADILLVDVDLRVAEMVTEIADLIAREFDFGFAVIIVTGLFDSRAMAAAARTGARNYLAKSSDDFENRLPEVISEAHAYIMHLRNSKSP